VLREFHDDPHVRAHVATGRAAPTLLAAIDDYDADLIAVGRHGVGRTTGIVLGSIATRLIHDAPCSVLVVPRATASTTLLQSILVGVDGSLPAADAEAVATVLGEATGAQIRRLIATGGKPVGDETAVMAELDPRRPVEALVDHSGACDLLIVGSRGLHGIGSLGSVAERVAHQARCPVLIVRGSRSPSISPANTVVVERNRAG
jgi:nucleotide-binding universal stress UspA family protein